MALKLPDGPLRHLTLARTALGAGTVLAPAFAGKVFLLRPEDNPQLPFVGRMWGIRNLALAASLAGLHGPERRAVVATNVAVDVGDLLAVAVSYRARELSAPAAALIGATAAFATVLGARGLRG